MSDFELVRYLDGDLRFDGSLVDGGGRLVTGGGTEILFETDSATGSSTSTTFVGITGEGGTAPAVGRYEIDSFSGLRSRIIAGTALDDTVTGDGADPDEFVDAGNGFDISMALNNVFSLDALASTVYTTKTIFGEGSPEDVPDPTEPVLIDIKPGSDPNSINLKSKGVLPVAILSTDEFDVLNVDIDSLLFVDPLLIDAGGSPVSPLRSAFEDVTGDALLDLSLKFSVAEMVDNDVLGSLSVEGLLTAVLLDGTGIEGSDAIRIVPELAVAAVPEPSTAVLSALGLLGVVAWRRRKRKLS